jgi:hypothetical protein
MRVHRPVTTVWDHVGTQAAIQVQFRQFRMSSARCGLPCMANCMLACMHAPRFVSVKVLKGKAGVTVAEAVENVPMS